MNTTKPSDNNINLTQLIKMQMTLSTNSLTRKNTTRLCVLAVFGCLAITPLTAQAGQDSAFVDSVHGWGSWDLGLEPAAGGPVIPRNNAVRVNQRNVQFRPNENNTFSGGKQMVSAGANPTLPPVPTGTATIETLAPGTPAPTGGPNPGF